MQFYSLVMALIFFSFSLFNFGQSEIKTPSSLTGFVSLQEMTDKTLSYEEALANSKPTVIEFYADWCTTCRAIAPTLAQLHQQYPQVNFVMFNIDEGQSRQAINNYQVTGVPHLVFLKADKTVEQTLVGDAPKSILKNAFEHLN